MKIRLGGVSPDKYQHYQHSSTEVTYFLPAFGKSQGDNVRAKVFMRIHNHVFIKIKGKLWGKEKQKYFIMFLVAGAAEILTWEMLAQALGQHSGHPLSLGTPASLKQLGQRFHLTEVSKHNASVSTETEPWPLVPYFSAFHYPPWV